MIRWAFAVVLLLAGLLPIGGYAFVGDTSAAEDHPLAIAGGLVLIAWPVLYLVVGTAGVVDAIVRAVRGDMRALATGMIAVKLSSIPFFLQSFVVSVGLLTFLTLIAVPAILTVPVAVAITYLVMLPTSAYGIAALVRLRRDRMVGAAFFWILLPMHLLFVVDIVASLIVFERIRRIRMAPPPPPHEWQAYARLTAQQGPPLQSPPPHPPLDPAEPSAR